MHRYWIKIFLIYQKTQTSNTKKRISLAQLPPTFALSNDDLRKKTEKSQEEEEESTPLETDGPLKTIGPLSENKEATKIEQLTPNEKFNAIATALALVDKNSLGKRKHDKLEQHKHGVNCLLAFINAKKINNLDDFLAHQPDLPTNNNDNDNDSTTTSNSSNEISSSNNEEQKRTKKEKYKGDDTGSDKIKGDDT